MSDVQAYTLADVVSTMKVEMESLKSEIERQAREITRLEAYVKDLQAGCDDLHGYIAAKGREITASEKLDAAETERDRYREALDDMAKQHLPHEMDDDPDDADYEGAYIALVTLARQAIKESGCYD